jgi:sugar phosphate permease
MSQSQTIAGQAERDAAYGKITRRIIPFLILGYIAAYLDRSNIGFARVQMLGDLGFTELVYGFGAGLFYLGYSALEVPSNLLMKKVGARVTFARIMILWGIISAGFAFVTTATQFSIMRFLLGAAEAGFFPGVLLYITYWIPSERRARFTAMFMSALVLSGLIGGPISGVVMAGFEGLGGMRGWQWLFIVEATPSIILGIITLLWLADSPLQAKWLTDREKAIVMDDLQRDASDEEQTTKVSHTLWEAFLDYRIYVLSSMAIALVSGIGGLSFWLPTILHQAGIEGYVALGVLAGIPYLIALGVQQWMAYHSDKTGERRWHVAICAFACATAWFLLPSFSDRPWISLVLLVLACSGAFGATGPFWTMPSGFLSGTAAAGGIALVSTLGGMFAFLSPTIVGWATDQTGTLAAGQYYYGSLFFLAAIILLLGTRVAASASDSS